MENVLICSIDFNAASACEGARKILTKRVDFESEAIRMRGRRKIQENSNI